MQHIYIHLPFCKNKCSYCDFISFEQHEKFVQQYHNALCNEIKAFTQQEKHQIKTIFIGGGTPSLYPLSLFKELFDLLQQSFCLKNLEEATIEVNPEDVTKKHLKIWKACGINRLSIGVQILNEKILQQVNRHQTNQSVHKLLHLAPKYFENISVDLMLGLPGVTEKIWFDTLSFVTTQQITHLSLYMLMLYEKTPLYFKVKDGSITLPDDNWLVDMYKKSIQYLEKKDLLQYEISNFAKQGYESIHNQAYWNRRTYRGFGLNAASFDGKKRLVTTNNLIEYLNYFETQSSCSNCFMTKETLTPQNIALEELMLGLRKKEGVDLQRMVYSLHRDKKVSFKTNLIKLKEKNLISEKNGRLHLTILGMVLENEVIVSLM